MWFERLFFFFIALAMHTHAVRPSLLFISMLYLVSNFIILFYTHAFLLLARLVLDPKPVGLKGEGGPLFTIISRSSKIQVDSVSKTRLHKKPEPPGEKFDP